MLTTILLATTLLQGQGGQGQDTQQPPQVDPAAIVSKMLARYHGASSLVGQIRLTQSAMGRSIIIDTALHVQQPSKVFLRQEKKAQNDPALRLLTSDGKMFSYDPPPTVLVKTDRTRLIEPVAPEGRTPLTVKDMYTACLESLVDRSMPLDVVISKPEHLTYRNNQWVNLKYVGKEKLGEVEVHVIEGKWREYKGTTPSADFQMLITEEGDLKRYAEIEVLQVRLPTGMQTDPQQITSIWEVNIAVNGTPDASLFKVVK